MKKLNESLEKLETFINFDGDYSDYWDCIKQYISLTEWSLEVFAGKQNVDKLKAVFEKDFEDDPLD